MTYDANTAAMTLDGASCSSLTHRDEACNIDAVRPDNNSMFQDLIATASVHTSIAATNKHRRREGMEPMEEAMIMMIGKNGKDLSNSKYHFTFWKG